MFLAIFLFLSGAAQAGTIEGTWSSDGKTLIMVLRDDRSDDTPVAGQIWNSLPGMAVRNLETQNLAISCDGKFSLDSGKPWGKCEIRASHEIVMDNGVELQFAIWDQEAGQALAAMAVPSLYVLAPRDLENHRPLFSFHASSDAQMVAGRINSSCLR